MFFYLKLITISERVVYMKATQML